MKKPKKIFIPSTRWAFVAGEARQKHLRFVLTWWRVQTKKLKFPRFRQVLSEGGLYEKTKINFYSFDGPCISLEKRAKTNRRFCPYLVRETFAETSNRPSEDERETSLRKELSTVIDEVSVGDRREPASGHAHACVEKSVSGAFLAQESDLRRKKNKISSSDGGLTSSPEIRHTPDFLILLSGGGIPGKTASGEKKRKFLPPMPGGFPGEKRCAESPITCPSLVGDPMPKGGKRMSDKKKDETSKAPSEMTVRYYDAAEVEKLEVLHKRMGGSLNAFLKSLIQAGYERLAPVYLGAAQEPQKAADSDPDLKETVIAAHETEMALLRRIEAQNSKILPSVYCVMNVVTPTDPEMKQIVDSGYMDREPARFRDDKGGEKR